MFCKAGELLSFTRAAHALGITPAAVSRSVARTEARLGVALFVRSTRQVRLTDDGALYFTQCKAALELISETERVLSGHSAQWKGTLRVSTPTPFAHHWLLAHLPVFQALHPQLLLDLHVSNRNIDFANEEIDVAIRLGDSQGLQDSRLIARQVLLAPLALYASPAYLKTNPAKTTRTAELLKAWLEAQRCIGFVRPSTGRVLPWLFQAGGEAFEISPKATTRIQDDPLAAIAMAEAGMGLVQTYRFVAHSALTRGSLVEVHRNFSGRTRAFYALYPQRRHLSPAVRAFVDWLAALAPSAQK